MAGSPNILGDQTATAAVVSTVSRKKGWADLNLALPLHPIRKDILPLRDDDAIKNAVKNLILTNFYERPFQPEKAAHLRGILFEPADSITKIELRERITNVIEDYEPRVKINSIQIRDNSERNHWDITIFFAIKQYRQIYSVNIVLQRLR
jgi:phage baseplate assembly protein W